MQIETEYNIDDEVYAIIGTYKTVENPCSMCEAEGYFLSPILGSRIKCHFCQGTKVIHETIEMVDTPTLVQITDIDINVIKDDDYMTVTVYYNATIVNEENEDHIYEECDLYPDKKSAQNAINEE